MTQITIGNSDAGTFDFTGSPPASLLWASPGLTGTAYFGADVGAYSFAPFAAVPAGPLVGGNFATNADQAFAFSEPGGDALTGVVHWNLVRDHSPSPALNGILDIAAVTGDAEFTGTFSAGQTAAVDVLTVFKYASPTLDALAETNGSAWTIISAGQGVALPPSVVPEPGTLALLGAALVVAWWLGRGRGHYTGRREVV